MKTLTGVAVGYGSEGTVEVAVDYKYNSKDEWETSDWVQLNNEGNAMLRVTALEHRIKLRATDPTSFNVEQVTLKYQYGDRRFRRGPVDGTRVGRNVN